MPRVSLFSMTLCLLLGSAGAGYSQDNDQEARAILDKAVKAHGGEERLSKIKTWHNKSKGTLYSPAEMTFAQEVLFQAPSQMKVITHVELEDKKTVFVTIINGDKASLYVDGQARDLGGKGEKILTEIKELLYHAQILRFEVLRKDKTVQLKTLPEIKIKDRPAVGVRVSAKGHRDFDLYFDKEKWLLVKTEWQTYNPATDQLVREENFNESWKEIDGVQVATKNIIRRDGKKYLESEVTEVEFKDKIDESVFTEP